MSPPQRVVARYLSKQTPLSLLEIRIAHLEKLASEKVQVRRKDTGRKVWVFKDSLKERQDEYEEISEKNEGEKILDKIKRPKGWRSWEDEPNLKRNNKLEWLQEHSAETLKGSVLLGTPHLDYISNKKTLGRSVFEGAVMTAAIQAAEKAISEGKKVTFLAEGSSYADKLDEEPDNEQWAMAVALNKRFGNKITQDSWDDDEIYQQDSKTWDKLEKFAGGRKEAQASIVAFLIGQGDNVQETIDKFASEEIVPYLNEQLGGVLKKNKEGVWTMDEEHQEDVYRLSFPGDYGDPPTKISAIGDVYNAIRQDNMLRKIKKAEAKGGVAIVLAGASHAYSLKNHLES